MRSVPAPIFSPEEARTYRARGYWGRPTVAAMLAEHAREAPGRLAVADELGAHLTYGQLARAVRGAAAWMRDHGLRRGDAVVMALDNTADYVVAHLAASAEGLVSVMMSAREGPGEIAYAVEQTAARMVLLADGSGLGPRLERLADHQGPGGSVGVVAVATDAGNQRTLPAEVAPWPGWYRLMATPEESGVHDPRAPDGGDIELVVFSSGTTGRPKGIAHTYDGTGASLWNWIRTLGLTWHDPVFCPATFGHVGGAQWGLRTAIATGAPLVVMRRWDPAAAAALIGAHGCTYTLVTPTYIYDLTELDAERRRGMAGFRFWTVGGSRMEPSFVPRAERALGGRILRGFGMSEHFMATITRPDDPEEKRATRDGRALPGVRLEVWDDAGRVLPAGSPGEMVYRGPSSIGGYFTDPAETERTFQEGWQRTGDIVVIDAEGFIEVIDRKKEMIIRGGENISPQEIEDVLRGAGLAACAVVGVPDDRLGERAALVCERATGIDLPSAQDLLRKAGIAKYKWPELVVTLDELPRTALGKLQRGMVRERAVAWVREQVGASEEDQPARTDARRGESR